MNRKTKALEELSWQVRRLFRSMAVAADRELATLGISVGDRALLELLAREAAPISISDLARKRRVSRQHIQQSLQRLKRPEWVQQVPSPEDGRVVLLSLSRSGRSFWTKVRQVDVAWFRRMATSFSEGELEAASETLGRIRKEVERGED